jgi:NAD(P)H-nitrite reductase large subunit
MKRDDSKYLIIGNSVAAVAAVEAIRSKDSTGRITIISDEPYSVYSRPLITYFLSGKVDEKRMFYRDGDFCQRNKVVTILGERVMTLYPQEKKVVLENGRGLHFDRLLLSTGGTPIIPQIEGKKLRGVFTFTRWNDARQVRDFIESQKVRRALVVGGGLIGLKVTEALVELGVEVTVVELADRLLGATFDRKASELVKNYIKEFAISVLVNNTITGIKGENSTVSGATLRDGTVIDAQLIVFAIGVRPNTSLAEEAGIEVNRGVVVNEQMETSVPDIYAAGDVAEGWDALMHARRPLPIWPVAHRQGSIAGYNMAGLPKKYPGGFPMNSVELCGLPTISAGLTDPHQEGYEILQDYRPGERRYRKIVLLDNRIVGAIFVGDIDRAGIIIGLIKAGIDVKQFKDHLISEDFGLLWFPQDYRKHIVEGPGIEV